MKLLDVEAILGCGPDIQQRQVMKELDDESPRYAILSHRWGNEEVGYEEMIGLMGMEAAEWEKVRRHKRYQKIIKSCNQAKQDGYRYLWIDTCCIDKRSSAELSEAINSMYQWYQNAQVCYAYLNDVQESDFPAEQDEDKFRTSNGWPEWFMRGWTLQELIAPREVEFFNRDWVLIGNKRSRADVLEKITQIPREVLTDGLDAKPLCVAQIMSWAAHRKTTRVEDRAYSLMGLFGVNMPMVYGEGKKAFRRLQLEILKESSDHSIFSWIGWTQTGSVLAEDPSDFRECGGIKDVEADEFVDKLIEEYVENIGLGGASDDIDNQTHHDLQKLAALRDVKYSQQFRTFTVSNTGIQVFLPVVPHPKCPSHFAAILACSGRGNLVTIDLVSSGSSFDRTSVGGLLPATYPEFKILHLTHHQDTNKKRRDFTLDDKHTLHYGFTRRGTYPRKFTGDTITLLSATDDLIVVVYDNEGAKSRFAVGLGYYLGQGWVHVVYHDRPATREDTWTPWLDFASSAWDRMWNAREEHYQRSPEQARDKEGRNVHFVKHAHLPRSTLAARVVWGRWEMNNLRIMIDVAQCPGCCDGPNAWTATFNDFGGLGTPGLMNTVCNSYKLKLDGWPTRLDECFGHGIALGDYGDYSDGNFNRIGNIFADMWMPGIDSAYRSVTSRISGFERSLKHPLRDVTFVTASPTTGGTYLTLRQPEGISLPSNEHLVLLLKAISSRLSGKHLVTTIIQCSGFYVHTDGARPDSGDELAPEYCVGRPMDPEVLVPLCIIANPQVWRRELPCVQRREQFKNIREHFYTLLNMHPRTEACSKCADRHKKRAIESFSDLFGLKYLKNFVGKITFFERLSSMAEATSCDKAFVGTVEEDAELLAKPPKLPFGNAPLTFQGDWQFNGAQVPRREAVIPWLLRQCQIHANDDDMPRYADEKQEIKEQLKSISQTPSASLLTHIRTSFSHVAFERTTNYASHADYDRQLNAHSKVEQITELQKEFDVTEDDDERRILEESITGKILWFCWCGICAEVEELLPKVLDCIEREGNMMGLLDICDIMDSTCIDPDDNLAHLQRIMFDAGAGISKRQLFVSTTDIPSRVIMSNQGTIPRPSC